MKKDKYLWYTDTHLDKVFPWTLMNFIRHVLKEKPKGVFLTGDISNGLLTTWHLRVLATFIRCPIYFVLGNHDYHFSSIENTHKKIRELCQEFSNLIWMRDAGVVKLTDEVALVGTEGWYDAENGRPDYLQFTMDWFLTQDFRELSSMDERIAYWRHLAQQSAKEISSKIEQAIEQGYQTVYVLTHFPPGKRLLVMLEPY